MTYNEALDFNQKWTEEQAFNDLERYLLRKEPPAMKAVAICMRAAKKQIPKKPKQDKRKGLECYCPVCGDYVGWKDVLSGEMMNYCGNCGQAIDWSDVK